MNDGIGALVATGIFLSACAKAPPEGAPVETPMSPSSSSSSSPPPAVSAAAPSTPPLPSEAPTAQPTASAAPASPFECQIRMAPKIKLGQPMTLHFTLTSHAPSEVHVLKWRTPLEGMTGSDFMISRNGTEIRYNGPMVKRGNPNAKSYASVAPGKALEADIDLALAYDFTKAGTYRVTFTGNVQDMVTKKAEVPRTLDQLTPVPLVCAPIGVEVAAK